jgi:hypothetical protein
MGDMTNYLIRHGEGRFEAAVRERLQSAVAGTGKPTGEK